MELKGIDVFSRKALGVKVEKGIITDLETLAGEVQLPYIAPGFFDIQVNGYRGNDYNAADLNVEHICGIVTDLDAAGVTRYFPTIVSGPCERTLKNLAIVADLVSTSRE
ncbi:MAG: hypothetical protein JSV89_05150 [Spirochaetaceae bacterium]|nr:MAG: hypothetical protein JSV89_05150 [Spirochaetaceae bacterium]